jgi:hypothetical protein
MNCRVGCSWKCHVESIYRRKTKAKKEQVQFDLITKTLLYGPYTTLVFTSFVK